MTSRRRCENYTSLDIGARRTLDCKSDPHITVDEIDFSTWRTAKHLRWFVKQHRVDCCDLQDGLLCWLDDLRRLPVTNAFGE